MVSPEGVLPPGLSWHSAKGPISRILSCAVIPLGAASPRTLISDLPGGFGDCIEQPCGAGPAPDANPAPGARLPPYLVLLRVGFTMPPALPPERCALTAPFHPYPGAGIFATTVVSGKPDQHGYCGSRDALEPEGERGSRGGFFSVALAVRGPSSPRPGRYPAHYPAEFGLSSPGRLRASEDPRQRPPGPPASR